MHVSPAQSRWWTARGLHTQGIVLIAVSTVAMLGAYVLTSVIYWLAQNRTWDLLGLPPRPLIPVAVGLAAGLAALISGMLAFTRRITGRLSVLADNAERISLGTPLLPVAPLSGEISRLATSHQSASTMIRAQERELRSALASAEAATRTKGQFLSRVSHELRTPLNAVLGFGQLIEMDEDLSEDQHESIDQILRAGRHLLDLIDELLLAARDEASDMPIVLEPLRVVDVIAEAVALVAPLAEKRSITVHTEGLAEAGHLGAMGDHQRLMQVLLNLLSNALKYNHDGGVVIADCREGDGDVVRIEVTDTGIGLDLELLDRVFTPFDRLGAESSDVQGSGVGLSLSLSLVQAMGGTILVDSAVGVGSTFIVELARTPPPFPTTRDVSVTEPRTTETAATARTAPTASTAALAALGDPAPSEPPAVPRAPRLLYVEDNEPNFRVVEMLALRCKLELIEARTGREGIELAVRHRPNLVLLDLHLPDQDGHQVLDALRADPDTRDIPVFIISADATEASISRLLADGADEYLTKPLDLDHLARRIDETLALGSAGSLTPSLTAHPSRTEE
jgi:signal transduction histidine kinase/ActR/RegA family two-component response regulator